MARIFDYDERPMDPTHWRYQQLVDSNPANDIELEELTLPRLVSHMIWKDVITFVGHVKVITRHRVCVNQIKHVPAQPCAGCGEPSDVTTLFGERLCPDCASSVEDTQS